MEDWKEQLRKVIDENGDLVGNWKPDKPVPIKEFCEELQIIKEEKHYERTDE